MSADLREKLGALAKEWDAWANTGVDGASALETCADELTALLASHEEREGEEPWPEFVSRVLDMAANSDEGPDVTLAEQGHAITRTEEWLRSRLRSHTDREPEPRWYVILDEDGDVLWGPLDDRAFMEKLLVEEAEVWAGATLHGLYIGPPVQPEEPPDA